MNAAEIEAFEERYEDWDHRGYVIFHEGLMRRMDFDRLWELPEFVQEHLMDKRGWRIHYTPDFVADLASIRFRLVVYNWTIDFQGPYAWHYGIPLYFGGKMPSSWAEVRAWWEKEFASEADTRWYRQTSHILATLR